MDLFFVNYGGMDASPVPIPVWIDLIAVLVGGLSGVLAAQERKLDLVGYLSLALICGLGGGLIRDVILQKGDVYLMTSPYAIPAALCTGLLGFFFPGVVKRHPHLLEWVDIISVALFVAAGTDKAVAYACLPTATILLGSITGVGGGMLRDVCLGEVPHIFRRSNLYAICSILGALVYWVAIYVFHLRKVWCVLLCLLAVVGLRRWSLHYNVLSPESVNLAPKVKNAAHSVREVAEEAGHHHAEKILEKERKKREPRNPTFRW